MKVLMIITSSDEKGKNALRLARGFAINKRFEDFKVFFFGSSQKMITELEGDYRGYFEDLVRLGAIDGACIGIADAIGVKDKLERMNIKLAYANERISYYINNGYIPLVF